jgi:hypothetical protein
MPALFPRWTNTAVRATLIAALCALVGVPAALMGWVRSPNATRRYALVAQPVAFDHRVHVAGLGIDCRYCHFSVERSAAAGIPPSTTCVPCHDQRLLNSATLAPVRLSAEAGRPLEWNRVHRLPDFVYFNHAIHVAKGVGCETCHGRVDRMAAVYQAAPLTMGWCVSCHRDPAPNLRPASAITAMGRRAPAAQPAYGKQLQTEYHVRELTSCSTCHR